MGLLYEGLCIFSNSKSGKERNENIPIFSFTQEFSSKLREIIRNWLNSKTVTFAKRLNSLGKKEILNYTSSTFNHHKLIPQNHMLLLGSLLKISSV